MGWEIRAVSVSQQQAHDHLNVKVRGQLLGLVPPYFETELLFTAV